MTPTFELSARLQVQADSATHARGRAEALADVLVHGEAALAIEPDHPALLASRLGGSGATPPDPGTASPCIGSAIARHLGGPKPRRKTWQPRDDSAAP